MANQDELCDVPRDENCDGICDCGDLGEHIEGIPGVSFAPDERDSEVDDYCEWNVAEIDRILATMEASPPSPVVGDNSYECNGDPEDSENN